MKTNVVYLGNCLNVLSTLPDNSVDSIVTDPPYELGFMGKSWDNSGIAYNVDMWKECLRVLKPGGHLLAFSGTRTYHRMAVAIEDAGFEVRDMIEWVYASGFPKSLNIGKAVDKLQGNEREVVGHSQYEGRRPNNFGGKENGNICYGDYKAQPVMLVDKGTSEYEGWGTALKPSHEPICLARKPLAEKTVAENCLKYGTGGINIDESRVEAQGEIMSRPFNDINKENVWNSDNSGYKKRGNPNCVSDQLGRFPANLIHDNSEEVRECFPDAKGWSSQKHNNFNPYGGNALNKSETTREGFQEGYNDSGNASRFFKSILYYPKASKSERNKGCEDIPEKRVNYMAKANGTGEPSMDTFSSMNRNNHPTVKPVALMSYLIKMITPKGGIVLEPFAGSGSTLVAARDNGFQYIGIELTEEYLPIIQARTGCEIIKQEIVEAKETVIDNVVEKQKDICECGGKIIKLKDGTRCCEWCIKDY